MEQTILFGTECFIKIHKEIENVRAKKKEVVNFVIFLGNKKNGIVKTKMSKNIGGRQRKNLTDNTFTSILYPAQLMSF